MEGYRSDATVSVLDRLSSLHLESNQRAFSSQYLRLLRLLARGYNAQAGLAALPAHVLCRLAEHLRLCDRITLAQVSFAVRSSLLSSPTLWARAVAASDMYATELPLFKTILSRAGEGPLDITLHILPSDTAVFDELPLAHIRSLSIHGLLSCWGPCFPGWQSLWAFMRAPAPSLEHFRLEIDQDYEFQDVSPPQLPPDLFNSLPGKMKTLTLRGVLLPTHGICPALKEVETLHYLPPSSSETLSPSELDIILSMFPHIQTLTLRYQEFIFDPDASSTWSGPPSLSTLHLLLVSGGRSASEYFKSIHRLEILTRNPVSVDPKLQVMRVDVSMYGMRAHLSRGSDGALIWHTPMHMYSSGSSSSLLSLSPFAEHIQVAVLNIHESEWSRITHTLSLPNLQEMTMYLSSCGDYDPSSIPDAMNRMTGVWQTEGQLVAPQLSTIYLVGRPSEVHLSKYFLSRGVSWCSCANGCTLSLNSVENFFRMNLQRTPKTRLARLVLANIQAIVDVDLSAAFSALSNIVDVIDFAPTHPDYIDDVCRSMIPQNLMHEPDWNVVSDP